MKQSQFLNVVDRDQAEHRFRAALDLSPLGTETLALAAALGHVLAEDVRAENDVPGFTRSNVDGFAVLAADTFRCHEEAPVLLTLNDETVVPGMMPARTVRPGTATSVATGGMLPRGADAMVMVEHTTVDETNGHLQVRRPVAPGAHLSQAGSDIARGETVLRRGARLTARETGVLAALGRDQVQAYRRPRVAIFSTGDELVAPGKPLSPGQVHDCNATLLADAVRELGGEAVVLGIVPDQEARVEAALRQGLQEGDVVLLSGGTSKGAGDINVQVVERLASVQAHGVALKPGKPLCLAVAGKKPVVVLPGFPTSAIFTFHEFVAPVLRAYAGLPPSRREGCTAVLPQKVNSEIGRTEYLLVGLVRESTTAAGDSRLIAVPQGKGSGSVTAFSRADGFITIPRQVEYVEAGVEVEVTLLGRQLQPPDLVIQGSHCLGLDLILDELHNQGVSTRFIAVGSTRGLEAVEAGRADLAGIHLLHLESGVYNRPFLRSGVTLLEGYGRMQGVLFRSDDTRFQGKDARTVVQAALAAGEDCVLINRNRGSGTRLLVDELLAGARPPGFSVEARSHHAVAAAIAQKRSDWGVAIQTVADLHQLGFLPLREERFDFAVAPGRENEPAVILFSRLLQSEPVRERLRRQGFLA